MSKSSPSRPGGKPAKPSKPSKPANGGPHQVRFQFEAAASDEREHGAFVAGGP